MAIDWQPSEEPRAWGYVRGSTDKQTMTLEAQQTAIHHYYEMKLKPLGVKWGGYFSERAVSGKVPLHQRPEGAKLVALVRPGDYVVFAKLDRGFRNSRDFCNQVYEWNETNIKTAIIDIGLDTTTPLGLFVVTIMAAFATMEREMISERTRTVAQERKRRGLPHGGKPPYGYKLSGPRGNRIFIKDPFMREMGRKIVQWRDAGHSFESIYWHLARHHQRIKGKEWSLAKIWRTYHAEKQLQEQEKANANQEADPECVSQREDSPEAGGLQLEDL